jgi:hypothetical protein
MTPMHLWAGWLDRWIETANAVITAQQQAVDTILRPVTANTAPRPAEITTAAGATATPMPPPGPTAAVSKPAPPRKAPEKQKTPPAVAVAERRPPTAEEPNRAAEAKAATTALKRHADRKPTAALAERPSSAPGEEPRRRKPVSQRDGRTTRTEPAPDAVREEVPGTDDGARAVIGETARHPPEDRPAAAPTPPTPWSPAIAMRPVATERAEAAVVAGTGRPCETATTATPVFARQEQAVAADQPLPEAAAATMLRPVGSAIAAGETAPAAEEIPVAPPHESPTTTVTTRTEHRPQ